MLILIRLLVVTAAIGAGWPLAIVLVELACTTPLFDYCGGHANAGVVYLSFWVLAALMLWLAFNALVKRWTSTR